MNLSHLLPWLDGRRQPTSWPQRMALETLGSMGNLYGGVQFLRAHFYQVLPTYHAPCPVISVGNLTTGGTGKTPMVWWLASYLQQAKQQVGVVSRGYLQHSKAPITVVADPDGIRLTPPMAADEAALLATALPGITVLTGKNRPDLIRHAVEQFQCNFILMDDGFQRLDVHKELNLLLLDAQRPFGNGRLLPGGLLREFPNAINRCDAIVLTRAHHPQATQKIRHYLQTHHPNKPVMTAIHRPTAWIPLHPNAQPLPLDALTEPVLAFCGLATPEAFLHTLQAQAIHLTDFRPFPDHHVFSNQEITQLENLAKTTGAKALVCTEKDAIKLINQQKTVPIFALRVEMSFQEKPEWLENRLQALIKS